MSHHVTNARALPTSERGEFERIDLEALGPACRRMSHIDRVSAVLSDNPRWIAGADEAEAKFEVATTLREKYPDGVWMYNRHIVSGTLDTSLDILAITTTGVWMIEVVEVGSGRVSFPQRQGLLHPRSDSFLVDGDDYTEVLTEIDHKARCIANGLEQAGRPDLMIQQVLCLLKARAPGGAATRVLDCYVATLPQTVRLMKTGPSQFSAAEVGNPGLALGEKFRRPRRN